MIDPLKFDAFGRPRPQRERSPLEIEHDLACAAEQERVRLHYEARAAALPKLDFKPFPPNPPGDTRPPLMIALEHAIRADAVIREANAEAARSALVIAASPVPLRRSWLRRLWDRLRQMWRQS